jgi:hypothetical protein
MAKILFKRKDFATGNYARSGFVKKIKQNDGVSSLKNRDLKKLFLDMKKASDGGPLYVSDAKSVLGKLKYDHGDHFSGKKARIVGRSIFKSGKWYKNPGKTSIEAPERPVSTPAVKAEKTEKIKAVPVKVPMVQDKKIEKIDNSSAQQPASAAQRISSQNIAIPILYKKLNRSNQYLRSQISRSDQTLSKSLRNLENSSENEEDDNEAKEENNIYKLLNDINEGNKK